MINLDQAGQFTETSPEAYGTGLGGLSIRKEYITRNSSQDMLAADDGYIGGHGTLSDDQATFPIVAGDQAVYSRN